MSTKCINRKQVKEYALFIANQRAHPFTRVASDFYLKCEGQLKVFIRHYVSRLPSKGKTIH